VRRPIGKCRHCGRVAERAALSNPPSRAIAFLASHPDVSSMLQLITLSYSSLLPSIGIRAADARRPDDDHLSLTETFARQEK